MTRAARHDRAILPPKPQPVRVAQSALQSRSAVQTHTIELCWSISTLASESLMQKHACTCTRTNESHQCIISTIVLSIQPAKAGQKLTATLEAIWHDSTRSLLIQEHPTGCRWCVDHQNQLEHVDIAGVVHCTFAQTEAEPARTASTTNAENALFVHTPWLARVGIKPGTYALSGMRVLA